MFKKGDFIIQLHPTGSEYLLQNNIYMQNRDYSALYTDLDSVGTSSKSSFVYFNRPATWRYATASEIEEYRKRGKPFDIREISRETSSEEIGNTYEIF